MPGQNLDCERQADAAAFVLRALGEQEAQAFQAHLAECPICVGEVAQLQIAADALAAEVPQREAPAELYDRVMAPVRAEVQRLGLGTRKAATRATAPTRPRGVWRLRLAPALSAAAALGVGLLIGALAINSGSSVRTQIIRAEVVAPGHRATAELRKVGAHLELVVVGMPAPPPGRIYEVWLERGSLAPQPTNVLFSVTKTGDGTVGVPDDLKGLSHVLVTDEPLGGSLKPTRTPVIVAKV
jgi:hypothetical protein